MLALLSFVGALSGLLGYRWAKEYMVALGISATASFDAAVLASRFCPWRRQWLLSRFATERLRQWYFQRLLDGAAVEEAVAGDDMRKKYLDDRSRELSFFIADLRSSVGARMANFQRGGSILDRANEPAQLPGQEDLRRQVLSAYYALRLRHQLDYATHKMSVDDQTFVGQSGEFLCVATDKIAAFTLVGSLLLALLSTSLFLVEARRLAAGTLLLALCGVAVRAWRDGLAIGKDQERYADYRCKLEHLSTRWDSVKCDSERLALAREVEDASSDELRSFLRTHESAQFLF
jgi:hypothetical protein